MGLRATLIFWELRWVGNCNSARCFWPAVHQWQVGPLTKKLFTITAEIHARSLVNFYGQYAGRHMNLNFMRRVSERERAIRQFVIVKKQIDVSFSCACSIIDNEFRDTIVKVVCGSNRLSPRGSTPTLTMWWRNLWSITGQTHKKLTSICLKYITQAVREYQPVSSWRTTYNVDSPETVFNGLIG